MESEISNDALTALVGYGFGRETRLMILKDIESGMSIQEACSIHSMPTLMIIGNDGKFEYQGKRITATEFKELHPLGEHVKLVTIGTKERNKLHAELDNQYKTNRK